MVVIKPLMMQVMSHSFEQNFVTYQSIEAKRDERLENLQGMVMVIFLDSTESLPEPAQSYTIDSIVVTIE